MKLDAILAGIASGNAAMVERGVSKVRFQADFGDGEKEISVKDFLKVLKGCVVASRQDSAVVWHCEHYQVLANFVEVEGRYAIMAMSGPKVLPTIRTEAKVGG